MEYPFLRNSDSTSLQVVNENLCQAWASFFKHQSGQPRFHSRKYLKQSYTGKSILRIIAKRYLKLPKLGYLKTSKTNRLKGVKIKRYTLSWNSTDRYYLSCQVEKKPKQLSKTGKAIGIDVGLADLAILSNGKKYKPFDGSYFEKKTRVWQRKFSRRRHQAKVLVAQDKHRKVLFPRSLDSFSNWQKARRLKARYQAKVANQRQDYLHKLTTKLVKDYDVIAIEDLKVKDLQKDHYLADSIANASWRLFRNMLVYKCQWYGKKLITVDPRNTSRICHTCGYNSGAKPLNIRQWTCLHCGQQHDRDINAAINILNKSKAKRSGTGLGK